MIRERLAEILEIDESRITLDSKFAEDLDADSLALIELVEALEEELGERTVGFTLRRRRPRRPAHRRATRSTTSWPGSARERSRPGEPHEPAGRATADPDLDARLQLALGWTFPDPALLDAALAHRSYCAEHGIEASNERLEFLGDSVLGFVVTTFVFDEYPQLPEGELAKLRASVVNAEVLAELAARSTSARRCGSARARTRPAGGPSRRSSPTRWKRSSRRSTSTAGWTPPALVSSRCSRPRSASRPTGPGGGDYKTRLQELAARRLDQLPRYQVRHEGPDHSKRFFASVLLRRRGVRRRARDVRRSRPSRPPPRRRGNACSSSVSADARPDRERSGTMPELPEVEVVRRDLEK